MALREDDGRHACRTLWERAGRHVWWRWADRQDGPLEAYLVPELCRQQVVRRQLVSRRSIGRLLQVTHRTVISLADAAEPEDHFHGQWQYNSTSVLDECKSYLDERCTRAAPAPGSSGRSSFPWAIEAARSPPSRRSPLRQWTAQGVARQVRHALE
ncbi:hypothetical protein ACFQ9Z_17995 [Streptomyces sp. NPDC056580]|uniref:hypothetical protein n=1 Tax=Streptomyces sp. NPDC056580 TaxID=3345872 RepID=UPI0036953674